MPGAHEPVDGQRGLRTLEGRRDRNGMNDVAQRAQSDDEEAVHDPAIFRRRSRVA